MRINKISLFFFQQFEKLETSFDSINFLKGSNGKGKTTLGKEAILFCLFGYSNKNLSEIPTLGISKTCKVEIEISKDENIYTIIRSIPSSLNILKNGEELSFQTTTEANNYIKELFGDVNNFLKFRTIDNEIGINFLDPKKSSILKEAIFSVTEEIFNEKKEKLAKIKQEREIWNKDNAVLYSHFPSEKRLKIYEQGIQNQLLLLQNKQQEVRNAESDLRNLQGKVSYATSTIKYLQNDIVKSNNQIKSLSNNKCYACGQMIDISQNKQIISKLQQEISNYNIKIKEQENIIEKIKDETDEQQEYVNHLHYEFNEINKYVAHLNQRKLKLESRLKQKNYIYSTRDVEVAKKAGKELDSLSTKVLVNNVKNLEPIINEVLSKINHTLEFDINEKGKFDIILTDEKNIKKSYKHLSTGQKLMLQIAFKLSILLDYGEEGLIIIDEGLSSLDESNLNYILNIFRQYPFQVIFMLHRFDEIKEDVKIIDLN